MLKTAAHSYSCIRTMFHENYRRRFHSSVNKHMWFCSALHHGLAERAVQQKYDRWDAMRAGDIWFTHVFNFQRSLKGSKMCGDKNLVIYDTYFPLVMRLNFTNVRCDLCCYQCCATSQTDKLQIQHITTTDKGYKSVQIDTSLRCIHITMFHFGVSMSSNFHAVVFISIFETCNIHF